MRYLYLWLRHFPTDCWQEKTGMPDKPLVMAAKQDNTRRLVATDQRACLLGLTPGMALADSLARYPYLHVVESDPAGDQLRLRRLALWCLRFSPLVEIEAPDGICIDITGCAGYWKGEDQLLLQVAQSLRPRFSCRLAIADTIGAASALARFTSRDMIMPIGKGREFLQDLSIGALRLTPDITQQLQRLGFRRIRDLYPLARGALASRFGKIVVDRLQQALGEESEAFSSLMPPPCYQTSLDFSEPIGKPEDLTHALNILMPRLCTEMGKDQVGARQLIFTCYRVDQQISECSIGLAAPSFSPGHLYPLLHYRLDKIDPGFGIEKITLAAPKTDPVSFMQSDWQKGRGQGSLPELVNNLAARLGNKKVFHLTPIESHIPEKATGKISPLAAQAQQHRKEWAPPTASRPIRLLPHPEPIDALAPIPDDPPLQFRWRKALYRVKTATGPERIEPEWWQEFQSSPQRQINQVRDYYQIEDMNGRQYWIYRAGLYQTDPTPRWFLHGFF